MGDSNKMECQVAPCCLQKARLSRGKASALLLPATPLTSEQGFSASAVHRNNQETPKSDISLSSTLRDSITAGLLFSKIPSAAMVAKPLSQTLTHLAQVNNTLIGILSTRKQVQTGQALPCDNR